MYALAQLGARMHYGVARILARAGLLESFFTDFCASSGWRRMFGSWPCALRPGCIERFLSRSPPDVPPERIMAFNGLGVQYAAKRRTARSSTQMTAAHLWAGRDLCRLVLEHGLGSAGGIYGFNSAALELLTAARRRGLTTVLEQTIAPKRVEARIMAEARERFPGWERDDDRDSLEDEFANREIAEWSQADLVVCGSEFVRDAIAQCGGPRQKCVVVPYGFGQATSTAAVDNQPRAPGPLRILTVGAVGLRKGSPCVLELAKRLKRRAVFRMVGPVNITSEMQSVLRNCVQLAGPVPRTQVGVHFRWADVFLLPSLCEGSATVTYEALSHGLPVICTTSTGSVVRHEVDGYVEAPYDIEAIAGRLDSLCNVQVLAEFRVNALRRMAEFTLEAYGRRLLSELPE